MQSKSKKTQSILPVHTITEIQQDMTRLFVKYEFPTITHRLPMQGLHEWGHFYALRLRIDDVKFRTRVTSIFWALAHVQLEIGHSLIARESVSSPRGRKGIAFAEKDIPNCLGLAEIHFWHHASLTIECIYRCWERIALLLQTACYPNTVEKIYYDGIVNKIQSDKRFKDNSHAIKLKGQIKHWNKIAKLRNRLSHFESSPMEESRFEGKVADVLGSRGEVLFKIEYEYNDIIQRLEELKTLYLQLMPAMAIVQRFIESLDEFE